MNSGNLFIRLLLAILLLCVLSGTAAADHYHNGKIKQSALTAMLEASKIGHLYLVQPATSKIGFCIDSKFKHVEGEFEDIKGGFTMESTGNNNCRVLLTIRSDSVTTSSPLVDHVIKSDTFFDTKVYPEILFVGTGFEWLSETGGILRGNLTLHGVTRAVTSSVTLSDPEGGKVGGSDSLIIKISTTVNRSDFGMGSMPAMVSDKVMLCMRVQATKTDSSEATVLTLISH